MLMSVFYRQRRRQLNLAICPGSNRCQLLRAVQKSDKALAGQSGESSQDGSGRRRPNLGLSLTEPQLGHYVGTHEGKSNFSKAAVLSVVAGCPHRVAFGPAMGPAVIGLLHH